MEEIIHTFGIDWRLIAIQIFNFALLLGALSYFLYTPILKMIDERKRIVVKGVEDAEAASLVLKNAEVEKHGILTKAVTEASEIVKRGEEAASREASLIVSEAHAESARITSEGEKKAHVIADALRKESEAGIAKAALLAAEKILRERI
jgi:F-type H+-transporting ATPase subunit b